MPSLAEIIKTNPDKFSAIPGAQETAEKLAGVCKELGFNVIGNNEKEPEFIPKARLDELVGQKNEYKGQVAELNKQLEDLKKVAGSSEEMQKQIQTLQDQIAKSDGKAKDILVKSAAKVAALQAKAKDPEDVLKFLDLSKVTVGDNDTVAGIEEQIKALAENKKYLFGEEDPWNLGGGSNPPGGGGNGGNAPQNLQEALLAHYSK